MTEKHQNISDLLSRLRKLEIRLQVDKDRLKVDAPVGVLSSSLREELSRHKSEIIQYFENGEFLRPSELNSIPLLPRDGELEVSFSQERLWFLSKLEPGNEAYHINGGVRLQGRLEVEILEQSLTEIVSRHEALRTTFEEIDGKPVQVILPAAAFNLPVLGLETLPEADRAAKLQQIIADEARRPFDLSAGPLFRAVLVRLGQKEHVLVMVMHHIITDGWSLGVFRQELESLYSAFYEGRPSPLADLPVQYADYAAWQRERLQGKVLDTQVKYWKQKLGEALPILQLPTDRPRPAVQTHHGARHRFDLPEELSKRIEDLSRRQGVTLYMMLLAALKVLLYRYTGQADFGVGSPIANRTLPELESLIGFFVNTLVLRTDMSGDPGFIELLSRVRETTLGAFDHQELPFEKLVEIVNPAREMSYSPLFQVMFVFQNMPRAEVQLSGLKLSTVAVDRDASMFDLTLFMWERNQGLSGSVEYNTDLFDAERIERMVEHFQTLLEGIVADPGKCIGDLPILDEAECRQLLIEWNDTAVEYPRDECLHKLFEKQVERTPDAAAVIFGKQRLSYRELNTRANQLAHYLRLQGVVAESRVGIWMDRSLDMMVALLGTLKAGGAYVPLDPSYPQERLAFMLEDAQAPVLLTREKFLEDLAAYAGHVVCLDKDFEAIAGGSEENPISDITADSAAYVIYTSGSTGAPKGVIGLHRGAVNRLSWMWRVYPFKDGEVCCQKTYLSFVDSVWEIFGPLLKGVPTVIIPEEVVKDPHLLVDNLAAANVSRILLVPSLLGVLLDSFGDLQKRLFDLKIWVSSGEEISVELAQRFRKVMPGAKLINLYGSSEVSADVSCYEVADGMLDRCIPTGRPIDNTSIYILDSHLQPVPIGVPGELYIGGVGLARGYLNQPDLTAERFIPSPFGQEEVLFKTGDLSRYLPDGNLEYLGRRDHQVKVRGFRVELGEIESQLKGLEAVSNCVVVLREDRPADQRLTAYYVCKDGHTVPESEVRRQLQAKLPQYMLPQHLVELSSMPLTPNGKVDRQALPQPQADGAAESSVKPRDEFELQLTKIWEKVLGIKNVGIKDNFFDLGGHSLLAMQLFARIQKIFGNDLPLTTLFQAPTIGQLADVLRQEGWSSPWSSLVPMQHNGSKPPFFCVHGCGGIVFHMQGFARHLFPEQPFYGLKGQGLEKGQTPHTRIEDMAAFYIKEMQTVQPDGPYYIGGTGYGGAVVLEVAQQLKSQEQNVVFLALINAVALKPSSSNASFIRSIYGGSFKYFYHRLADFMRNRPLLPYVKYTFFNRVLVNWDISRRFVPKNIQREHRFREAYTNALLNYTPHDYPGRITCFLGDKFHSNPQRRVRDWYDIASGGLDVRFVPGTIEDIWRGREPSARILAEQLKACLEEAQTNSEGFINTKN